VRVVFSSSLSASERGTTLSVAPVSREDQLLRRAPLDRSDDLLRETVPYQEPAENELIVAQLTSKTNLLQVALRQTSEDRSKMNRSTAKQIDLTIPPTVLARVDRVIR